MTDPPTSGESARVREAIETVYEAFASPAPAVIEGCPCCISTRGVDVLLNTPLRELTGQQLWRYVSGAYLTLGSDLDFRYLLPRILDISVNDPGNANDPEIVIGKLARANWRSWPAPEQAVIEELLDAWFEFALTRDLAAIDEGWVGWDAERILCGFAHAGLPLTRWILRLHDPVAAPVLADLKERFPGQLSAFWEDAPDGFRELSTVLSQGRA
jgi:hypothetical protein